jgi:very-long-chain (3R)-3-hydroxyacyl-CoA dehydratase
MSAKTSYLLAYNAASLLLWSYLILYTLSVLPAAYSQSKLHTLYGSLLPLLTATQTAALLEILHATFGLVRASPLATALQIGGKNLVVWTVMTRFPEIFVGDDGQGAVGIWGFLGCLLPWGFSEIIRYGYFVVQLTSGDTPNWLKWLR